MVDKGICQKHGEFNLFDGCPQCLAERQPNEQSTGHAPLSVASTTAPYTAPLLKRTPVDIPTETALVKVNPNTDPEVVSFYNEAIKLQEYAQARIITTVEDLKPATDDLTIIRRLKKAMEEKRKEYVKPLNDHVDSISAVFKTLMQPINIADKVTGDKMLAFTAEQERIRREQEEINRLRLEAAQKEAALNGGVITESVNLVEVVPEAPKRIETEMGTVGQRDNWRYEVIDFALVPDSYKMINAGILTPVVKASKGKIIIPGIRIFNEVGITVKAR